VAVSTINNLRFRKLNKADQNLTILFEAAYGMDNWLESMRRPGGYSGPVVHWWDDSLIYQGPGLDWRYEGIIIGYLNLWMATNDIRWLQKAQRAGDDLINGQLPSGNFRNSRFELNPGTGGTPHEAACDLGLLRLAGTLRDFGDASWQVYKNAARWNLEDFHLKWLWSQYDQLFFDNPNNPSFVPNKAATLIEALFEMSRICKDESWVLIYALPTLEAIIEHQVRGGILDGAIFQNSIADKKIEKFFPFYIARCVPALIQGYEWTKDSRFAEAAYQAGKFLLRWRYEDGSFPQVIYSDRRISRYPQWVAGLGDIMHALDSLSPLGVNYERQLTLDFLLAGRKSDGGIRTANGFGNVTPFGGQEDFRDDLSVCGWADKAFRYLTGLIISSPSKA